MSDSFIVFALILSYTFAKLIACFRCTFDCSAGWRNENGGNLRKLSIRVHQDSTVLFKNDGETLYLLHACRHLQRIPFFVQKFYVNFKFMDMTPYRNSETS